MEITKISKYIYEIPKQGKMNVPGRIFASEKLIRDIKQDKTLEQVRNIACLPGILKASMAMSDAHQGYGFPIGGVAAFDPNKGIISPGGVGYDINCSIRLLKTNLTKKDILDKQKKVIEALYRKIPSGLGRGSKFQITKQEFKRILEEGVKYMIKKGYGIKNDYLHTEENGCMKADANKISEEAIKRGIGQLGTLGAGNHFLDIHYVEKIFDKEIADVFGLKKEQVTIMIHCGSRGLGHQVASDYIKAMGKEYGFPEQDRELVNAPINSQLGKDYYSAMNAAANFAFANKQLLTYWIREEMKYLFPKIEADVVYDVCHNIAKFEKHMIDGKMKRVLIHRKGATRSFGVGRKEIPEDYREIGQPVIIPGSMGTASYLLLGTKKAEELSFGSTAHGAGRVKSRTAASKEIKGEEVKKRLYKKGIEIKSENLKFLAEEAPEAYKDIDEVIKVIDWLGISKKIIRLKPLAVMMS